MIHIRSHVGMAAFLWGALGAQADKPLSAAAVHPKAPNQTGTSERWLYAGENHGIRFFFKIANECRETGASVGIKLESILDYPVTVSFRVNDPNWSKTFQRDLTPGEVDTGIKFTPGEGTACHPFVDEVYVDSKETQVSKSEDGAGE
jgi:hypothetical protein